MTLQLSELVVLATDGKVNLGVVTRLEPLTLVHPHGTVVWTNQRHDEMASFGFATKQEFEHCYKAMLRILGE